MNNPIICFVAGKSGGHIIPCLTLADEFLADERSKVLFFSSNTNLDKKILAEDQRISWHIMLALSKKNKFFLITLWYIFSAFIISFFYLCKYRPKKIITTGGIVAIPTCLAGFILRIPIFLYSLDAVPGKAIKFLTPLATNIFTCFSSSKKYFPAQRCKVAAYPIKYKNQQSLIHKETALQNLGLSPDKKTLLVLGGSQGSLFLNNCMKQFVENLSYDKKAKIQVIHQTGALDTTDWKEFYKKNNIIAYIFSYTPNLEYIYASADLIICRAGAGTLFEAKFFNKRCIVIPLETNTTRHQIDNAYTISTEYFELFCILLQKDIQENHIVLTQKINALLFETID